MVAVDTSTVQSVTELLRLNHAEIYFRFDTLTFSRSYEDSGYVPSLTAFLRRSCHSLKRLASYGPHSKETSCFMRMQKNRSRVTSVDC